LRERQFYKTLIACDTIIDCMDEKSGIVEDLNSLREELDKLLSQ